MSRFENIPCTRDCPDRDYKFCITCEKLKEYKKVKRIEYEQRVKESQHKDDDWRTVTKRVDLFNKKKKKH